MANEFNVKPTFSGYQLLSQAGHESLLADLQSGAPLAVVSRYYASCLPGHQATQSFLARRQLAGLASATSLELGCCDRSLGRQLPAKVIKQGRATTIMAKTARRSGSTFRPTTHKARGWAQPQ